MEHKFLAFHKELVGLQDKDKLGDTFNEQEKIHGSHETLAAKTTEMESSLKEEKEHHQKASNVVSQMNHKMEKDQKIIWQEAEAHAKDLKTLECKVSDMREKFHNSLQRSIHAMLKTLDQVMEQVKGLCPEATIPVEELDPFLGCSRGGLYG